MTNDELVDLIHARHCDYIREFNKAKTKEEADMLLFTYYRGTLCSLAIQSECDVKGESDQKKVASKVERMFKILMEV